MNLIETTIAKINTVKDITLTEPGKILADTLQKIDGLGGLYDIFIKYASITNQPMPSATKKAAVIACADHGVCAMNVSAYPQETTAHMTKNYLISKGAVANCMSNFCGSDMIVVDMGIKAPVDDIPGLIDRKIAHGTQNCAKGPAMTREQAIRAIETGIELVNEYAKQGYRCFLPETKIDGASHGAIKRFYSGKIVKLVTKSGRELRVTANHPILTSRGWVIAELIKQGDNLIAYDRPVESLNANGLTRKVYNDEFVPTAENLFKTFVGHALTIGKASSFKLNGNLFASDRDRKSVV